MTQKVVTNDEAVTGSNKFFFAIFGTFGRYITNLRGTFVENVKKVENQPTLLYSILYFPNLVHINVAEPEPQAVSQSGSLTPFQHAIYTL
jgi:hypothetical protein